MSTYSEGLRHGWADAEQAIRDILAREIPDAEKLQRIGWQVDAPVISRAVNVPGGMSRAAS